MANPQRGEVDLKAGKKTYTLRFSYNAMATIEELLDVGINDLGPMLSDPKRFRIGTWRALLWGALLEMHPDLSLEDAGEIIGAAGVDEVVARIGEALTLFFPEAKPGASENPRTASPSAGTTSSSTSSRSATRKRSSGRSAAAS